MNPSCKVLLFVMATNFFCSTICMQSVLGDPNLSVKKSDPIEISQKVMFSAGLQKRKGKLRSRISSALQDLDKPEMQRIVNILKEYLECITDITDEQVSWINSNIDRLEHEIHQKIDDPVHFLTRSMIDCRSAAEQAEALKRQERELVIKRQNILKHVGTISSKIEEKKENLKQMRTANASDENINTEKLKIDELTKTKDSLLGLTPPQSSCTIV